MSEALKYYTHMVSVWFFCSAPIFAIDFWLGLLSAILATLAVQIAHGYWDWFADALRVPEYAPTQEELYAAFTADHIAAVIDIAIKLKSNKTMEGKEG